MTEVYCVALVSVAPVTLAGLFYILTFSDALSETLVYTVSVQVMS